MKKALFSLYIALGSRVLSIYTGFDVENLVGRDLRDGQRAQATRLGSDTSTVVSWEAIERVPDLCGDLSDRDFEMKCLSTARNGAFSSDFKRCYGNLCQSLACKEQIWDRRMQRARRIVSRSSCIASCFTS